MLAQVAVSPVTEFLQSSESAATILAIVGGAVATYYKFLRGRVFYPRLEVSMSSALLAVSGRQMLRVTAIVKNTGASRVTFDLVNSGLRIYSAPSRASDRIGAIEWVRQVTLEFTDRHKWIEPAEKLRVHWMLFVPENDTEPILAFRCELRVAGTKTAWYSDSFAVREQARSSAGSSKAVKGESQERNIRKYAFPQQKSPVADDASKSQLTQKAGKPDDASVERVAPT